MKRKVLILALVFLGCVFALNVSAQTSGDYFTYQEVLKMGNSDEINDLLRFSAEDLEIAVDAQQGSVDLSIKNVGGRTLYVFPPLLKSVDNSNPERINLVIGLIPAPSVEPLIISPGQTVSKSLSVGQVTAGIPLRVSIFAPERLAFPNGELTAVEEKNLLTVQ
jgi:hypothetical protein